MLALGAGCRRSTTLPPFDAGPPPDAPPPGIDTDGDGLCDVSEVSRGLDAASPDTDGDGFSDYVEIQNAFDALSPRSPDRTLSTYLDERVDATALISVGISVRGGGETYRGGFQSLVQVLPDGTQAGAFFVEAEAVAANPMGNVFALEGERALGVSGNTLLLYELRFAFPASETPRGCMRAYPLLYTVNREDGRIVAQQRLFIVVGPEGMSPDSGTWCARTPCT